MPRLKVPQVESSVRAPGPVETPNAPQATGEAFGASVGRGLQEAGRGLQSASDTIYRRQEQIEISDLNGKLAQLQADYTKKWQDTLRTAEPGDQKIADNFMADYDKQMEYLVNQVGTRAGQEYFDRRNAELRSHFQMTANASQAELAGVKARTDYTKTMQGLTSSLIRDPSLYESSLDSHAAGLEGLVKTGLLPSSVAAELRTKGEPELAQSAIRGWIKLNPDLAQEQLDRGEWDDKITADTKNALYHEVRTQKAANHAESVRKQQEDKKAKEERQTVAQNKYLNQLLVTKDFNLQAMLDDENLEPFKGAGSKDAIFKLYEEQVKSGGKMRVDSTLVKQLFDRAHLPDGDPNKITDENEVNKYFGQGLDDKWLAFTRNEVQGRKTEEGKAAASFKKAIEDAAYKQIVGEDKVFGLKDPFGSDEYLRYLSEFEKEWQNRLRRGVSARQMADVSDKEYMGNFFKPYVKSFLERMNAQGQAMQPKNELRDALEGTKIDQRILDEKTNRIRKKGETVEDWVKRLRLE
jgi:hypothetical protein